MTQRVCSASILVCIAALAPVGGCQRSMLAPPAEGGPAGGAPGSSGAPGSTGGAGFGLPETAPAPPPPMAERACATESRLPERPPVDLLFVIDASSSMLELVDGGTQSKWQLAQEAILGFMRDPGSAGLNVGLQFFPLRARCATDQPICLGPSNPPGPTPACPCPGGLTCITVGSCTLSGEACTDLGATCATGPAENRCRIEYDCPGLEASCTAADYRQLALPFGPLPGALAQATTAIGAVDPTRNSGTPTGVAVTAGLEVLRAQAALSPGRRGALVLVTDGEPTKCLPELLPGAARAAAVREAVVQPVVVARQTTPAISVFAVGVFSQKDITMGFSSVVTEVATAAGTGPFVIAANRDLTRLLQDAFNQIRRLALPCEYLIPLPANSVLDYGKVNVHLQSASKDEDLPYVTSADRCDAARGGWYYDTDPATGANPTRVVLCPTACTGIQDDPRSKIDLRFGCKPPSID
jgi:hypothetical protein